MIVLGAPKELEALVELFEKLYVCTFDCATFCFKQIQHIKVLQEKEHDPPLRYGTGITVFIYY